MSTAANTTSACVWCGAPAEHGFACPRLAAVEFHADGVSLKRVEFVKAEPVAAPKQPESDESFRKRLGLLFGGGSIHYQEIQTCDGARLDEIAGYIDVKRA